MIVGFPDGTTRKLHDPWHWTLEEAERRYDNARNEESRAEYLRILKVFSDLVLQYKLPCPLYPGVGVTMDR